MDTLGWRSISGHPLSISCTVSGSADRAGLKCSEESMVFSLRLFDICSSACQPYLKLKEKDRAVSQQTRLPGVDGVVLTVLHAVRGQRHLSKNSHQDPVIYLANSLVNYVSLTISRGKEKHTWAAWEDWLSHISFQGAVRKPSSFLVKSLSYQALYYNQRPPLSFERRVSSVHN